MMAQISAFFVSGDFLFKAEMLLRIVVAVICGIAIGYERKNRGKGAGLRTHAIVALAACLMTIISQYGFEDFFAGTQNQNVELRLDPTRIAAQIVSGIGFLGAGMIFIQKNVVTGLTTAAGIWATAGIGMAIGAGMYFLGISCAVMMVVVQIILHKNIKFLYSPAEYELRFVAEDNDEIIEKLTAAIAEFDVTILGAKYKNRDDGFLEIFVTIQEHKEIDRLDLMKRLRKEKCIKSASF